MKQILFLFLLIPNIVLAEDSSTAPANQTKGEADLSMVLKPEDGVDFICQSNIYYKIERTILTPTDKPEISKAEVKTEEIHFSTIGEQGINGLEVKDRVVGKIPAIKAEAIKHCRLRHESNVSCISGELKRLQSEYERLDFSARRILMQSIKEDCKNAQAKCVSATESPVTCYFNRPPDQPIAEKSDTDVGKAGTAKGKK